MTHAQPAHHATPAIIPLPRGVHAIELDATPPDELMPSEVASWTAARETNPRLHDGIFASVTELLDHTPGAGVTIRVRREHFARLVIQKPKHTPRLLGLKAVLLASDAHGTPHMLAQRRHPQTRVYPGCWEIGPGGGLDVANPAQRFTTHDLFDHLLSEISSELGLDARATFAGSTDAAPRAHPTPSFAIDDTLARSLDLCFTLDWPEVIESVRPPGESAQRDWEVTGARWLAKPEAPCFVAEHAGQLAPPALAILRHLGWVN